MSHLTNDPSHEEIAKRLARVAGHTNSLKRLWDEGRECDDMLTQIAAVRAGLDQVGKVILEHHIEHRVTKAVEHGEADLVSDAQDRHVHPAGLPAHRGHLAGGQDDPARRRTLKHTSIRLT